MKKVAGLFLLLIMLAVAPALAQEQSLRKFVVADIETRVPIRGAIVFTGDGYRDTTNYRGVCYIPTAFDTLSVYRNGYLTERLLPKETGDTTFVIPSGRRIDEVTVWGKDPSDRLMDNIERWIDRQNIGLPDPGEAALSVGFDLGNMLDKRARRDRKHLRKVEESFRKMDEADKDPIVVAYRREMERKRQEEEQRKAIEERAAKLKSDAQEKLDAREAETEKTAQEMGEMKE